MKYDVTAEDLVTWATALGDDPVLLRQLATLSRQFGTETSAGAAGAADLSVAAVAVAGRFDTVLTTLAEAVQSLRTRLTGGSGTYAAAEGRIRGEIRTSGG